MRVEELTLTCSFFKYSNKLQRRNHSNMRTTKVHTKHAQPQQQNTLNPNNKTRSTPTTKHCLWTCSGWCLNHFSAMLYICEHWSCFDRRVILYVSWAPCHTAITRWWIDVKHSKMLHTMSINLGVEWYKGNVYVVCV